MSNTLILIIGWLIGQVIYNLIKTHDLQKSNEKLNYKDAALVVFWKGIGTSLIAFSGLLAIMFIFPEFLKNVMEADDSGKAPAWAASVVRWLRASSVAFGMLSQFIVISVAGGLKNTTQKFIDKKFGDNEQ